MKKTKNNDENGNREHSLLAISQDCRACENVTCERASEATLKGEDGKGKASFQFPSRGSEWGYLDNTKNFIFWLL